MFHASIHESISATGVSKDERYIYLFIYSPLSFSFVPITRSMDGKRTVYRALRNSYRKFIMNNYGLFPIDRRLILRGLTWKNVERLNPMRRRLSAIKTMTLKEIFLADSRHFLSTRRERERRRKVNVCIRIYLCMWFASETRFYVYLFKQHALFFPPRIPILPRQWEEAKRNVWRISGAIQYTPVRVNTGKIIFACLLVYPATLGQWGVPAGASYINIANNHGPVSQAQKNITPVGTGFVIYSTESIPTFTYNSIISRQTTTLSPPNSLSIFYFHSSLLRVPRTQLLPLSHPHLTETGVTGTPRIAITHPSPPLRHQRDER